MGHALLRIMARKARRERASEKPDIKKTDKSLAKILGRLGEIELARELERTGFNDRGRELVRAYKHISDSERKLSIEYEKPIELKSHRTKLAKVENQLEEEKAAIIERLGFESAAERVRKEGFSYELLQGLAPTYVSFISDLALNAEALKKKADMNKTTFAKFYQRTFVGLPVIEPFNYFFGHVLLKFGYRDVAKLVWEKRESIFVESKRFNNPEKYIRDLFPHVRAYHRALLLEAMDTGESSSNGLVAKLGTGSESGGTLQIHALSRRSPDELEELAEPYRPARYRHQDRGPQQHRMKGFRGFTS